ncbi:hypothetical protein ACFL04_00730 [Patescibacteria group bacterium]
MLIKADYHMHPNLPASDERAIKQCQKYWAAYQKYNIKNVVVTEHAYKNPKRAYYFMKKTEPPDSKCYPGVECVTKEGIDIVLFSDQISIYSELAVRSYQLDIEQFVRLIKDKNGIYGFIPHPYAPNKISMIYNIGYQAYLKYKEIFRAVEISNGSYDNLLRFIKFFPLKIFFRNKINIFKKTQILPLADYPKDVRFLAVGSDAHHYENVGNCYEFEAKHKNSFNNLIDNQDGKIKHARHKRIVLNLIKVGMIINKEIRLKKKLIKSLKLNE